MIDSIELTNALKYEELNQLIIDFIQTYPWIGTTLIENKIKHNYSKIDFLIVLKLHKDDLNFSWEILYHGPYANKINYNDIWDLREFINWSKFTKTLYDHDFNGYRISKHDFIEKFRDYLDWNFLRKQQIYKDEYYGFESIK